MRLRCPHCHSPIEVVGTQALSDISCPSCGSNFNLISGETTHSYAAAGRTIGHFQLLEQLGVGHFGSVWKARDTELDRLVAIKIPRKEQLEAGDTELFFREARAAAQLRHPNIVSVHEVGRTDDTIYIASDFIDGCNLKDWLSAQKLTPREAAELCATIAEALHHAHESGVVHRDLKPGNIMMSRLGLRPDPIPNSSTAPNSNPGRDGVPTYDLTPFITDFGLAKRETGEITMTIEGQVLGTPAYMSPEQARGEAHTADRRSDIYSLGVILFELLTGELPFRGDKRMLLVQILNDDPPSPRKLNARLPRDLETICLKCLEKDPAKRYPTAAEVAADLRRYLSGESIHARPISGIERSVRWCRRNPRVAVLSAAVILLLVTVATVSTEMAFRVQHEKNLAIGQRNRANDLAVKEASARVLAEKNAKEANNAKQLAEANADAARKAQTEAKLAQAQATENAKVASEQADLALNTLQSLIFKVQEQLQDAPATQQLKQDILRTAMDGLKLLAQRAVKSHGTEHYMAAAHLKMGLIFKQLGQSEEAFTHFVQSFEIFQARLAANPHSGVERGNLAAALTVLGDMSQELRRDVPAALKYYQQALKIREDQSRESVAVYGTAAKIALAETYMRIGVPYLHLGEPTRALDYFQNALSMRRGSANNQPNDVVMTQDMARSLMAVGEVKFRLDDAVAARTNYDEALGLRNELLLRKPNYAPFKWELAATLGNFLEFDLRTGHIESAQQHAPRYVTLMDELVQLDPRNADYQRHQALAYYRSATLAMLLKNNAEAERLNKECLALRERQVSASPNNDRRQMDLMLALPRCGEHARAAKLAETMRASQTIDREALVEVARALAQCAAVVANETFKTQYRQSALDAIEKSIEQGYKDVVNLRTDPDLDALREHPQFQELLAKIRQR